MPQRIGKYEILETTAAGGQGTAYGARDGESGDVGALKVMHPGHTGEVQYLEALRQEANLASRLDHWVEDAVDQGVITRKQAQTSATH